MSELFIYDGQYKTVEGLESSFQQYWSSYGKDIKDDNIRLVVEGIYNILYDDIGETTKADNHNQTIFDRIQFDKICDVITQLLGKYIEVESSDVKTTTDVARSKIKQLIGDEIETRISNLISNITEIKTKLYGVLDGFFKKTVNPKKQASINVNKIISKLSTSSNQKIFKSIKDSTEYKQFLTKLQYLFTNQSQPKIKQKSVFDTAAESIEDRTKILKINNIKFIKGIYQNIDKSTIPLINSFLVRYGKVIVNNGQKVDEHYQANTFLKHIKKIKHGLGEIGRAVRTTFGVISSVLSGTVKTLFKMSKSLMGLVLAPLKVLTKLITSSWFTNIMVMSMTSKAGAFMFGVMTAFVWKYLKSSVENALDFVTNNVAGWILKMVSKIDFESLRATMNGLISGVKSIINAFKLVSDMFFQEIPGVDGFFKTIFGNLLKLAGYGTDVIVKIFDWLPVIFKTMVSFTTNPLLRMFSHMGFIPKMVALTVAFASQALNKLYTSDKDGNMSLSEEITKNFKDKNKIKRRVQMELMELGKVDEAASAQTQIDMLDDEMLKLRSLGYMLENIKSYKDEDEIPPNIASTFTESQLFNSGELDTLLQNISNTIGGTDFMNLMPDDQILALEKLLEFRLKKTNQIYSLYDVGGYQQLVDAKNLMVNLTENGINVIYDEHKINNDDYLDQDIQVKVNEGREKADSQQILRFDSESNIESAMKIIEDKGISEASELGQFLVKNRDKLQVLEYNTTLSNYEYNTLGKKPSIKVFNTAENKAMIIQFLKDKQAQTHRSNFDSQIKTSVGELYTRHVFGDGTTFAAPLTEEQQNELDEINSMVNGIIESSIDDKDKLFQINEILVAKQLNEEVTEKIMECLYERAGIDDYIIVPPSRPLDDMDGDRCRTGLSREEQKFLNEVTTEAEDNDGWIDASSFIQTHKLLNR